MRALLGIDAAWTEVQPSGVALVVDEGAGWQLVKVAASYRAFTDHAANGGSARHLGTRPDPPGPPGRGRSPRRSRCNRYAIVEVTDRRTGNIRKSYRVTLWR